MSMHLSPMMGNGYRIPRRCVSAMTVSAGAMRCFRSRLRDRPSMKAESIRVLFALVIALLSSAARAESGWDEAAASLRAVSLPPEQVLAIVDQARTRGLAPKNIEPWAERLGRLAQSGIPPAIAGERLAQGLAKGVPLER